MTAIVAARPCRRTRRAPAALVAAAALFSASYAGAQTATQEEADAIRAEIETGLAELVGDADVEITTSAPVSVTVAGAGYDVELPGLAVVGTDTNSFADWPNGDGDRLDIGTVRIRLDPDPVDEALVGFAIEFADLPMVVTADGEPAAQIAIGSQQLAGTWSDEIQYLTDVDMAWRDFVVTPLGEAEGEGAVEIGVIRAESDMLESRPGSWDGSGVFAIENVVATVEGETPVRMGLFEIHQDIAGMRYADYLNFLDEMGLGFGVAPDFASEQDAMSFFKRLLLDMPPFVDDVVIGYRIADLEVNDSGERLLLESHEFEYGLFGLAGELSNMRMRLAGQGMTIPDIEVPPDFVPREIDFEILVNDIPSGDAWRALEDAVAADLPDPEMIGMMVGEQMIGFALQAGTSVEISGLVDWSTGRMDISGAFTADAQSPLMSTGALNVTVTDMQAMIDSVNQTMGPEAAGPMTMIQSMGQQDSADDGAALTVYDFELSADGQVLMNGQDLGPMIDAMDM